MLDNFLLNLAANLAHNFLKTNAGRVRDIAFGNTQQRVLERAYQRTFEARLAQTAANLTSTQAFLGEGCFR